MRTRAFLVIIVLAAAGAFAAGWWFRGRSDPSIEDRTRAAAEHVRDAVKELTR